MGTPNVQQTEQEGARVAGPRHAAPKPAGPTLRGALRAVYHVPAWAVGFLILISMGFGLIAYQVNTLWYQVLFSIVWGITVLAMLSIATRWLVERRHHHAAVPH
jgi:Flp pilus assembly protein TadB